MTNMVNVIQNTIPISLFNKGFAGKIFEGVKQSGAKVVMKNNTAECVLLSPQEYVRLMDEVNDARLLDMAVRRTEHFDVSSAVPAAEVYQHLGITKEDLASLEEAEIE